MRLPESFNTASLKATLSVLGNVAVETLWPTRCAVCDALGTLLCDDCRARLPFIDLWRACPRCGAPDALIQCCICNGFTLGGMELEDIPLDSVVSALRCTDEVKRLVTTYKDQGEQRLKEIMAEIVAPYVPPSLLSQDAALTCIPASKRALRRRGFDHNLGFAESIGKATGLPVKSLFERPQAADQRMLGRSDRFANMKRALSVVDGIDLPETVIVVDDIFTTGSTMFGAGLALKNAGVQSVHGLTLARV